MAYPEASLEDVRFFKDHGWIVVRDAVDPDDIQVLKERCLEIIERRDEVAFDWAWDKGTDKGERQFRILQSSPTMIWPEFNDAVFRKWAVGYASTLMGFDVAFWYDQFLGKPPTISVPTYWHQDEGY